MARRAGRVLIANLLLLAAAPSVAVNSDAYPIHSLQSPGGSETDALDVAAVSDRSALRAKRTAASEDGDGGSGGGGGGGAGGGGQGDTGPDRHPPGASGALDLWALGVLSVFAASAARGRLTDAARRSG